MRFPGLHDLYGSLAARPKETALALAAIVVLPAVLSGSGLVSLAAFESAAPIAFPVSTLKAGEVNAVPVTFHDRRAEVELPRGFFLVVADEVRIVGRATEAEVEGGFLRLLVPPVNGSFLFNITSPRGRWAQWLTVVPGSQPAVSGEGAVSNLEYITQAFQYRFNRSPKLLAAAEHFRDVFLGLGMESEIYFYPWQVESRPVIFDTAYNILVVCGYQQGTSDSDEWIVMGAHMDTVRDAVEGAYDDGSGTSLILELARGLSAFEMRHTFVYCLWGGEEKGLYGSNAWVQNTLHTPVHLYVNLDMAGLSWPAPFVLTAYVGPDEDENAVENPGILSLLENMTDYELRYPREGNITPTEEAFPYSDHASFWQAGAPTVFFFGADGAAYPEYHTRDDTLESMIRHAGGRDILAQGFDTVVWMSTYLVLHADQEPLK